MFQFDEKTEKVIKSYFYTKVSFYICDNEKKLTEDENTLHVKHNTNTKSNQKHYIELKHLLFLNNTYSCYHVIPMISPKNTNDSRASI